MRAKPMNYAWSILKLAVHLPDDVEGPYPHDEDDEKHVYEGPKHTYTMPKTLLSVWDKPDDPDDPYHGYSPTPWWSEEEMGHPEVDESPPKTIEPEHYWANKLNLVASMIDPNFRDEIDDFRDSQEEASDWIDHLFDEDLSERSDSHREAVESALKRIMDESKSKKDKPSTSPTTQVGSPSAIHEIKEVQADKKKPKSD